MAKTKQFKAYSLGKTKINTECPNINICLEDISRITQFISNQHIQRREIKFGKLDATGEKVE